MLQFIPINVLSPLSYSAVFVQHLQCQGRDYGWFTALSWKFSQQTFLFISLLLSEVRWGCEGEAGYKTACIISIISPLSHSLYANHLKNQQLEIMQYQSFCGCGRPPRPSNDCGFPGVPGNSCKSAPQLNEQTGQCWVVPGCFYQGPTLGTVHCPRHCSLSLSLPLSLCCCTLHSFIWCKSVLEI